MRPDRTAPHSDVVNAASDVLGKGTIPAAGGYGLVRAENGEERKMASGSTALNSRVAGSHFRIIEPSLTGFHELGLLHGRGYPQTVRSFRIF